MADSKGFMLRMPQRLRDRVSGAAKANGRSINAEINERLKGSFLTGVLGRLDWLLVHMEEKAQHGGHVPGLVNESLNEPDPRSTVGAHLLAIREAEGLSQTNFAEKLKISLRAYQTYEAGQRSIPVEALARLQSVFQVDLQCVLSGRSTEELSSFSLSILAEKIGEESPARLERVVAGLEEPPFTLLDALAAHCKVSPRWLKHGVGKPFDAEGPPFDTEAPP